jgi:hypothetical protein
VTARYASANNGAPPHSERGHPHVGPAVTGDGGTNASYGFRRQFLVTAETVLRTLLGDSVDPGAAAVLIEPTCSDLGGTDGVDDDIVDFAIEAHGAIVRRVQVSSTRIPSGQKTKTPSRTR